MSRYVDNKIKDLDGKFNKYVCTEVGRHPQHRRCWDDKGNQKEAGGDCQSPKGCIIYVTPGFNLGNKKQSWAGKANFETLKNTVLKDWGLTSSALKEVELAAMFEKGKVANMHVYSETKKGTGEYNFELATLETHGGGEIKSIGYINVQSKGWIVKPRTCIKTKVKGGFLGGTRAKYGCKERSLRGDEIEKMRKTLEMYAFKSVQPMVGGTAVQAPACKREFNCYCYMQRNAGKVPSGGTDECMNAYEHFMSTGKQQGLKGTCCGDGAAVSDVGGEAEILFGGQGCKRGVNWDYSNSKKEIKVWGGCRATFKCQGDVVKCHPSKCPSDPYDDRRRRRLLNGRKLST
eukprot:g10242.t1